MINRNQFMEFFRSDEYSNQLDNNDKEEIFRGSLSGSSDFSVELINEVLSDHKVQDIVAVSKKRRYFIFGEQATAIILEYGIENLILMYIKNELDDFYIYEWHPDSSPADILDKYSGYGNFYEIRKNEAKALIELKNLNISYNGTKS